MKLFFISEALLVASALFSFLSLKRKRDWGCIGTLIGSAIGLIFSLRSFILGTTFSENLGMPIPGLNLAFGIDSLTLFFLMLIFGLSVLTSLYAWGYLKNQNLFLVSLPFFPLLVASMAAVVAAQDGFLFLICWEMMSLTSFFLVCAENELREVQKAGWFYLIATHLATAFLIVLFVTLQEKTGSFRFDTWTSIPSLSPLLSGSLFLFALIGFGTKAGIFPLHVWLPHAHPAAPSYISALMSGVMIKTGIYGLLRTLTFLGSPPLWWGTTLISLGVLSSLLGILYASVQGDLKKMLAYSSVENIGIIFIGIGLGLIGLHRQDTLLVFLSFGGSLLHILNHTIFKGLLFLGAGSLLHSVHTRSIEQLGGLLKKMPITGTTFLIGAGAISALPPFNGFISEFLIYFGLFRGAQTLGGFSLFLAIVGIIGMAFVGGLALACFSKVFGIVFLGETRNQQLEEIHEVPRTMQIPLIILAILCLLGGLFPQFIFPYLAQTLEVISPALKINFHESDKVLAILTPLVQASLLFLSLSVALFFLSRLIYQRRSVRRAVTWDCGYTKPSPRMQYTSSSFGQPIAVFFRALLQPHLKFKKPSGIFPDSSSFSVIIADLAEKHLFLPLFHQVGAGLGFIRKIQKGRIQNYLALIFVTLILLLLWEVWFGF